jgi:hypothetical protein
MPYYRRRLPHWIPDASILFITWRLAGSMPAPRADSLTPPPGARVPFVQQDERLARWNRRFVTEKRPATCLPSGSYTIRISDWPQLGRVLARQTVKIGVANIDGLVITIGSSVRPPIRPINMGR